MELSNNNEFVNHLMDHDGKGPFPPVEPTPKCLCGLLAFVKQSRHPLSGGRAFSVINFGVAPPPIRIVLLMDVTFTSGLMVMKSSIAESCSFCKTLGRVVHTLSLFDGCLRQRILLK
jgi:hypothetical protein